MKITQQKNLQNLSENYRQQKIDFLDNLHPNDFRNGASFNQAEIIIDQLNQSLYQAAINNKNPQEFIKKAVTHLFREGSPAVEQAINLANIYLEMRSEDIAKT